MTTAAAFAVLAAAGAVLRWRAAAAHDRPRSWPLGTLAVNVAGSFALGILAGASGPVATAVGTGGVGALTTWSGFAAHLADPARPRRTRAAYAAATVVLSVAAAWAGLALSGP